MDKNKHLGIAINNNFLKYFVCLRSKQEKRVFVDNLESWAGSCIIQWASSHIGNNVFSWVRCHLKINFPEKVFNIGVVNLVFNVNAKPTRKVNDTVLWTR